jgi:hypothetical protein
MDCRPLRPFSGPWSQSTQPLGCVTSAAGDVARDIAGFRARSVMCLDVRIDVRLPLQSLI